MSQPHLLCLGYGYTASFLAPRLLKQNVKVSGTSRNAAKCQKLQAEGIDMHFVEEGQPIVGQDLLQSVTHILHSIPPKEGDPVFPLIEQALPNLEWFGYLSTTGVYGDHEGNRVNETSETKPINERSKRRLEAENQWLSTNLPVHVFRLSGIYGPGRSYVDTIKSGGVVQPIQKKDHVFSRCHVEDIACVLLASIFNPSSKTIFNVSDDLPAAQCDVVKFAYEVLSKPVPEMVPFEEADISEMGKEFWADNKRVSSKKVKETLNIRWKYPTYKEGLSTIARGY